MAFGTAVLGEDRAQQRRYHGALAFADVGHGITHEMHTAALPGRIEDLGYSCFQAFVGVGDDQLHAPQATSHEAAQEVCPERLGLRWPNPHAQDFAATVSVHGHGDYYGDRDDASGLPHFDVGGIDPEVGPVTFKWPIKKRMNAFINLACQP